MTLFGLYIVIAIGAELFSNFIESKIDSFFSNYTFPEELNRALREEFPHLKQEAIEEILFGLKEYFAFHLTLDKPSIVPMPSRAVGFAYISFMKLKEYPEFVNILFGDKIFDKPPFSFEKIKDIKLTLLTVENQSTLGMHLWSYSCLEEGIDCYSPKHFPAIYQLDEKLKIASGFSFYFNEDALLYVIPITYMPSISELKREIFYALRKDKETQQKLARRLQYFLGNNDYCHRFEKHELDSLLSKIERNESLALAVYGKYSDGSFKSNALEYALPDYVPPTSNGGGGGCSSGGGGGC